ncbi:MAG: SURF1 family cytochrome oxidase biogenesis protein [Demequina sp.]
MTSLSLTPGRGAIRWPAVLAAVAFMLAAVALCGALGWWQWERAQGQATTVATEPAVPLAELLTPGESAGASIGRQATVAGQWADADAAVVWGRVVDDTPAVFLVRPLTVDAAHTGTGEPATLAVVVGWRDAADPVGPDVQPGDVTLTGYLRAGEASAPGGSAPGPAPPGTFATTTLAVSQYAQIWDAPLYSALLVSGDQTPSWTVLPPREAESELDFRSVAYAIEWWIFGAFFVFIAARWIRDNGWKTSIDGPRDKETAPHE